MLGRCRETRFMLVVLVIVMLAGSGCAQAGASTRSVQPTATATLTASPLITATALPLTPTPGPALIVSDPQVAAQLSFAYVQDNDVWASIHGAPPIQLTHFGLDSQAQLSWILLWSPDGSKLLVGQSSFASQQGAEWLLSPLDGKVTPCPIACVGFYAWLGDRYIIHVTGGGGHFLTVGLYDLQAQRALATALDTQRLTVLEVRGAAVYFTPYDLPQPPRPQDGVVKRFDLATNTITTAYTVPGPLILNGIPFYGSWDLSDDGTRLVVSFTSGSTEHCPVSACYKYYQDSAGTIAMIFPSHQSQQTGGVTISPDGKTAAGITSISYIPGQDSLVQQALPAGPELTSPIPGPAGDPGLGWTATGNGILLRQQLLDSTNHLGATRIFVAPVGSGDAPHLVETIAVTSQMQQPITFAPPLAFAR